MKFPNEAVLARWPASLALLIPGLVRLSGLIPPPQTAGNEGYKLLFAGDTAGAVSRLRRALAEDAAFPYRWSDLGGALADNGDMSGAAYCFARSVELGPADPQIALRAMNFQFRAGNSAAALQLGSHILRLVPNYDAMVFRSWVRMGVTANAIRAEGVGTNRRAAVAFFQFLQGETPQRQAKTTQLDEYWDWIERAGYADRPLARSWADWLLARNEPAQAAAVWARHVAADPASYRVTDWIDNGGFEQDLSGDGFDWTVSPPPGVTAVQDNQQHHTGSHSLRLDFSGLANVDFHQVEQRVWLTPGRYRLSAWIRTESLSTDQGIAVRLIAEQSPGKQSAVLDVSTAALTGTHGWTEESVEFTVSAPGQLAQVQLVRHRSLDFDNKVRGSAWIDDVALRPL